MTGHILVGTLKCGISHISYLSHKHICIITRKSLKSKMLQIIISSIFLISGLYDMKSL